MVDTGAKLADGVIRQLSRLATIPQEELAIEAIAADPDHLAGTVHRPRVRASPADRGEEPGCAAFPQVKLAVAVPPLCDPGHLSGIAHVWVAVVPVIVRERPDRRAVPQED